MRPERADMYRETMTQMQPAGMVVDDGDDEVQLHVRAGEAWGGLEKARALGEGRRDHAAACLAPVAGMAEQVARCREADAEIVGVLRLPGEDEIEVVLQVLPDAGQLVNHLDAVRRDVFGPSDTGQLKQLR